MAFEDKLLQLLIAGISTGAVYALIAVGFNVIFKSTDAINFSQGEWVMMGGLIAATAIGAGGMPILLACIVAVLAVAIVGGLSERLTIFPMRRPTPILVTLVTIGLAICTKSLVMLLLGKQPVGYDSFTGEAPIKLAGATIHPQTLWIIGITAIFMVATHLFFERTMTGKAMRAAAADRQAASLVGISVRNSVLISFVIAAAAGAIAGVIITPMTFMVYDNGTMLGFKGFSAAMLGGLGNLYGALVGGLVLGLLEALGGGYISSQFKDAIAFLVLLLVLFVRPSGLLGRRDISRI